MYCVSWRVVGQDLCALFLDFMYPMCISRFKSVYHVCIPPATPAKKSTPRASSGTLYLYVDRLV